jgi:hypothetical protein
MLMVELETAAISINPVFPITGCLSVLLIAP